MQYGWLTEADNGRVGREMIFWSKNITVQYLQTS